MWSNQDGDVVEPRELTGNGTFIKQMDVYLFFSSVSTASGDRSPPFLHSLFDYIQVRYCIRDDLYLETHVSC